MSDWVRVAMAPVTVQNGDTVNIKLNITSAGTFNEVLVYDSAKVIVSPTTKVNPETLRMQMLTFGAPPSASTTTTTYASINGQLRPVISNITFSNNTVVSPGQFVYTAESGLPNGDMDE